MKEKIKSLVINVFWGNICAVMAVMILFSLTGLLVWAGMFFLESVYSYTGYGMVLGLIGIASFVGGIVLSSKARKEKNFWYMVFNPTKRKGVVALTALVLYFFAVYIINQGKFAFVYPGDLHITTTNWPDPLSLMTTFIFLYPFSAALEALIFSAKTDKLKDKKDWLVVLIILTSPFTILAGQWNAIVSTHYQNIATGVVVPCGVQIMEVNKESSAEKAGLKKELIVNKIDGREIKSIEEHLEFFSTLAGERTLNIEAGDRQYMVTPKKDETGKYKIGISVQTAYCKK